MKENNKETNCERKSSLTQVSTTYARICVILLALNFCITGYVLTGVLKLQQEAVSQTQTPTVTTTSQARTAATESTPVDTSEEVRTLEKK